VGLLLGLDVSHVGVATAVVVRGELDSSTAPELARLLDLLRVAGTRDVALDLGDLEFVDSHGLLALVRLREAFVRVGGSLVVRHPRRLALRLIDALDLHDRLPVEAVVLA
jgi:anti-anti-sigma factor